MLRLNDIRATFLNYFEKNGHKVVPSAPLVPFDDPTLLFTNAGMVPFKNVFTGQEKRDYVRAASSQKCVRAGGKHNDLDNVGYTARHHTFFEMLGNFSFGDYFKEQAIAHAWELITKDYALPKEKLLVTVYHEDDEAANLWKKITGLPDDKIIRIATSDNFWSMGDTGPCGPCSEIFYDHGDKIWGGVPGSAEQDGDRFIEIWNLVFMQFEQHKDGSRTHLPKPSIDTGMGLERIAAILQGEHDNYDVDIFKALIAESGRLSGVATDGEHKSSHRVIADHLRSSGFLIADGVLPSNEGRGYVLRRIMRRAMRHAHIIGASEPLMYRLVPALVEQMGEHYGELGRAESLIRETLKTEEENFRQTLARGLKLLDEAVNDLSIGQNLPGETAFRLYDTYGFPLDLTQDILRAKNLTVDIDGFNAAMEQQKAAARASWSGSGQQATDDLWFAVKEKVPATEFLGYETDSADVHIAALIQDGKMVDKVEAGQSCLVVLDKTPCYAESGGQVGDIAFAKCLGKGRAAQFTNTEKKLGNIFVHHADVTVGCLEVGCHLKVTVDSKRRNAIRANHSATHIMHQALRDVLGDHVVQKGSLVDDKKLRFDFSHGQALTTQQIQKIEDNVNAVIRSNAAVETKVMTPDAAINEEKALALFGEKYGDEVRVLVLGNRDAKTNRAYSVELCGGTHVSRTGDIAVFKITSESGVASGVRRIEAVTGQAVIDYNRAIEAASLEAANTLKSGWSEVPQKVSALLDERKKLERELSDVKKKLAMGGGADAGVSEAETIGDIAFIGKVLEGVSAKELASIIDDKKKQYPSSIIVYAAVNDDKVAVAVGVTDDLVQKGHSAVDYVRFASSAVGGKGGGGRPDFAQAGGSDAGKAADAVKAVREKIAGGF